MQPRECWSRWFDKGLGWPATKDVDILSSLIKQLKAATEAHISHKLKRVAITAPHFPALLASDLNDDPLEHAGLYSWLGHNEMLPDRIIGSDAVFAANGFVICSNYTDLHQRRSETCNMPQPEVQFILFTRHALYLTMATQTHRIAFRSFTLDHSCLINFHAGLDNSTDYESPKSSWRYVQSKLLALVRTSTARPITTVLLAEENTSKSDFLDTLKKTLALINESGPK